MADKIAKLLRKLPPKQLRLLLPVVRQITSNDLGELDVKPLKGRTGLYRVRVGNYRIIFRAQKGSVPELIAIAKRDERTYRDL